MFYMELLRRGKDAGVHVTFRDGAVLKAGQILIDEEANEWKVLATTA